ncbi:hypothetical protein K8354_10705 [Polaribacter litorisediminis]|uniref:hypothetical protein n=1 Tax=Polaribacter litorisediminis TaxID=1908341 RepID=UPI001CBF9B54|nr:hypothetical protein [Polaribacter litorisediminis]UAM96800.1 hypothetical protein K8354_10705 [Polaribacter litorisediminis]
MKTYAIHLKLKKKLQIKHAILAIIFLLASITTTTAQCILPAGITTINDLTTVCSKDANNPSGILSIPSGATLHLNTASEFPASFTEIHVLNNGTIELGLDYTFPPTLLKIFLFDADGDKGVASGKINFSGNYFLKISTGTQIYIENTVTMHGDDGAALSGPLNQAVGLYIGSKQYATAKTPNDTGVCSDFSKVIANGGTPSLNECISSTIGSSNAVCFNNQPYTVVSSISGHIPFTTGAVFTWSKVSGPGKVIFGPNTSLSPKNTTENSIEVSIPGTYVLRVTAVQNLSVADCTVPSTITLTKDIKTVAK